MHFLAPAPPLTGICAACGQRAKVRKDGTLWKHRNGCADCAGSGGTPAPETLKRKWPAAARRSKSVQAASGGAVETDRRRH
jgi:hypothetical protein